MKKHSFIIALLAGLFSMAACQDKDWEMPENILTEPPYGNNEIVAKAYTDIESLQTSYQSVISAGSCKEIQEDVCLRCVVTGNDLGGNIYKQITVQDEKSGMVIGINGTDQGAFMPVGQKLLINLKGLYIGGYGGQAQLGTLYNGGIGRMELDVWRKHVRLVMEGTELAKEFGRMKVDTLDFDANKSMAEQGGKVVRLSNVKISGDGTQVLAPNDNSVKLTSNCANRDITGGNAGSKCILRTSTYSDFKNVPIPDGTVELYGIATIFNGTWQILARTETDLTWVK